MARQTKMNSITSPEKTEKINQSNLRLTDDFLSYLSSVQRSPKTIEGYSNDLLIFFTFVLERLDNKDFVKLTKRDIASFQNWLISENGNSPSRVRRIKSAISSMSNFVANVCDDDPEFSGFKPIVRKIEDPAMQTVRKKTVWSDEELDFLLEELTGRSQYKKACLLALAMYSGRRKSELLRFRVDDFKDENLVCGGALYKTTDPIKTKGFGLGKFIYCYTLAKKFKPYFDAWMDERESANIKSEWLFPDAENPERQMNASVMNGWAEQFSGITGKSFYWHSIRHKTTTSLSESGIPDNVIQTLIGWDSPAMVRLYDDTPDENRMETYFSDGDIKKNIQTVSIGSL